MRVRAAAVNFPDLLMTRGEYQHKPPLPFIPGLELAGEIEALGEGVEGWQVGDAVVGGARIGGFARISRSLRPPALRPKPARLSLRPGRRPIGAAYLTAYVALVRRARVEPGEWVLVHGAAGGVGLACVDLAKAAGLPGDRRLRLGREAGGDRPPNTRPTPSSTSPAASARRSRRSPAARGADVIYDPVGGDVFDESVRCIAFDGRLLVIGFTSGRIPTISVNMPLIKGFSVMGVRAGEYGRQFPDKGVENQRRDLAPGRRRPDPPPRPRRIPAGRLARRLRPPGRPQGDRQGGDPAGPVKGGLAPLALTQPPSSPIPARSFLTGRFAYRLDRGAALCFGAST